MTVAVLDIGKTNVKLAAVADDGRTLETLARPNPSLPGPPYRHHDVAGIEAWLRDGLVKLAGRHTISAVVATGHGSGGVLVDDTGAAMPMIDYEQAPPEAVDAEYAAMIGDGRALGSPILLGASHLARQMLWLERGWPEAFARARWFLGLPQYWAWRLSGVAASEVSILGAQSHLWDVRDRRFAPLVTERGWAGKLPPLRPAWDRLGLVSGVPGLEGAAMLCGVHDSTANFHAYQAAGLSPLTVVSTGTWIVALTDAPGAHGPSLNADVHGRPLAGALTMGGREFALLVADGSGPADPALAAGLVAGGIMALPSFGEECSLFPGTGGRGRITAFVDQRGRHALGVMYVALLTDRLLSMLGAARVVLDGPFVADPLYAALVAALDPARRVEVNPNGLGTAGGAALLAHPGRPVQLTLVTPMTLDIPGLPAYRDAWRKEAERA